MPHTGGIRVRKQPPSVKLDQTEDRGTLVEGMRRARSGDKCVSLCSTKTKEGAESREGCGIGKEKEVRGQGQSRDNVCSQKTLTIIS